MENRVISVNMLGGFTTEFDGKDVAIERNNATKVNQLLQLLLYFENGLQRTDLMDYLFSDEKVTNPSNSLRALVFRLRKALTANGFPDDEFVNISRGTYSWTKRISVDCDVHKFVEYANFGIAATEIGEKRRNLEMACSLYGGDFLPMLVGIEWVTVEQVKLRKLYIECAKRLCEIYIKKKNFEGLLEVSEKAAELYPYDEWQIYEMQALIELGRQKEAMRLYEETERMMFDELGVSVSDSMSELLDSLGSKFSNASDVITNVQKNLETIKEDEEGAFSCSYPVFTESYRYIKRVIKRSGQSAWLMLCTITDGKGYPLDSSDRLEALSDELSEAISVTLRGGDMYTKYSENQYLVLLLGIRKEDCVTVQERINAHMDKESRKRYIKYNLAPVDANSKGREDGETEISEIVRGME